MHSKRRTQITRRRVNVHVELDDETLVAGLSERRRSHLARGITLDPIDDGWQVLGWPGLRREVEFETIDALARALISRADELAESAEVLGGEETASGRYYVDRSRLLRAAARVAVSHRPIIEAGYA